jgi:hypothetical protein
VAVAALSFEPILAQPLARGRALSKPAAPLEGAPPGISRHPGPALQTACVRPMLRERQRLATQSRTRNLVAAGADGACGRAAGKISGGAGGRVRGLVCGEAAVQLEARIAAVEATRPRIGLPGRAAEAPERLVSPEADPERAERCLFSGAVRGGRPP